MSIRTSVRGLQRGLTVFMIAALILGQTRIVSAGNFNRNGAVGGVSINADGVLALSLVKDRETLVRELRKELAAVPGEMNGHVGVRKISLKGLEAACVHYLKHNNGTLPDEIKYLGGLQRVEYVLVYPELNDIVLAGPAEGWRVDNAGNVVGVTTGRPVLLLDDLLVALRTVERARTEGISCSIEPTEEGYRNLNALLATQERSRSGSNPAVLEAAMKEAFGPQNIRLQGIPASSHFARVLVAADYRMKRIAMKLDPSPVAALPSFVDMIKGSRATAAVNPRWWMACNYEPVLASDDGLVYQLRGPGVKVMTEDDAIAADGSVKGTGRVNPVAQKWADLMTDHYAELSSKDVIFAELRNLMDLCVVAAIIDKNDLVRVSGCSLPLLAGEANELLIDTWNTPRTVAPECSFLKTRSGWLVTASGGVQIESWNVAGSSETSSDMGSMRASAMGPAGVGWWWN